MSCLLRANPSRHMPMEPVVGYWGTAFISVGVIVSVLGGLATFYTVFLVFAAGLDFTLLPFIIYGPGTVLFVMSRCEQNRRVFSRPELIILVIAVAGAVAGIAALATGAISI